MRRFFTLLIVIGLALPAFAQDSNEWMFSGHFQGSTSSSGVVAKIDPTLGYSFKRHFQAYTGLPVYLVKQSSETTSTSQNPSSFMAGIGNAYVGLSFGIDNDTVNFISTLEATAPTGDKDKGFSTGSATIDWTNSISRRFSSITPFGSIGVANTVSDTSFFVRPFSSLGLVSHFDGGAKYSLSPAVDIAASAYAVRAAGEQRIISKVLKRPAITSAQVTPRAQGDARVFDTGGEIIGTAQLANDYGFSTWLEAHTGSTASFQAGYTRSAGYDLNSLFFGIGFRIGH
jgi:hypothetical protein